MFLTLFGTGNDGMMPDYCMSETKKVLSSLEMGYGSDRSWSIGCKSISQFCTMDVVSCISPVQNAIMNT